MIAWKEYRRLWCWIGTGNLLAQSLQGTRPGIGGQHCCKILSGARNWIKSGEWGCLNGSGLTLTMDQPIADQKSNLVVANICCRNISIKKQCQWLFLASRLLWCEDKWQARQGDIKWCNGCRPFMIVVNSHLGQFQKFCSKCYVA